MLLCAARRHRVGYSCACEDTNLTPHGETKAENIYHCPNVCESCGQLYARISNLLDSYYPKIIVSEPNK